jgi:hypothetical protein
LARAVASTASTTSVVGSASDAGEAEATHCAASFCGAWTGGSSRWATPDAGVCADSLRVRG